MASPSTETPPPPTLRDVIGHDDDDDHFIAEEEDEEEEDEWDMSKRMSRLSMEGSDGGDADDEDGGDDEEEEEEEEDEFEVRSDVNAAATTYRPWPPSDYEPRGAPSSASLPGTPERGGAQATAQSSPWWPGPSAKDKEYASETEARWPPDAAGRGGRRQRRARMAREVWLERAWRMRKQRRQLQLREEAPVVVLGGGDSPGSRGGVAMDMEEVRACRDLGLDLPCDWTVEIPCCYALSGVDTASSGGNSPASGSWRISSPGNLTETPAQSLSLVSPYQPPNFLFLPVLHCAARQPYVCQRVLERFVRTSASCVGPVDAPSRSDEIAHLTGGRRLNSSLRARPFGIKPTGAFACPPCTHVTSTSHGRNRIRRPSRSLPCLARQCTRSKFREHARQVSCS